MTRPPSRTVSPARLLRLALLPLTVSLAVRGPARAQGQQAAPAAPSILEAAPRSELRAFNFARNYGVRLNGGLSKYHPQGCMFASADSANPCLLRRDAEGFTFRFLGGPPGWQVEGVAATVETELTISPDGTSLVRVGYNGVPRQR
jgi:hypothetical protein